MTGMPPIIDAARDGLVTRAFGGECRRLRMQAAGAPREQNVTAEQRAIGVLQVVVSNAASKLLWDPTSRHRQATTVMAVRWHDVKCKRLQRSSEAIMLAEPVGRRRGDRC